jgi:hypothetical protein
MKELKALVNKLTAIKYQMIELEIRPELTDADLAKLDKLQKKYDDVELALHASRNAKVGA